STWRARGSALVLCLASGTPARSDQRQKDKDDSQRRHVPHEGAQQKNPRRVQGEIGNAAPKIELNTPLGHPTVRACQMCCQDACCKQGNRLDEILERPCQTARHAGQRRHSLITRACRPDIAALHACSMRGEHDLYQSKDDAESKYPEFKCHCCPHADCEADTIALPGTNGVDAPHNFGGRGGGTM